MLTRRDLYLALAKRVPDPQGGAEPVTNPYKTWKDVDSKLPDAAIEVLGPPPTSGTRDAFAELVMEAGCSEFPANAALKEKDEGAFLARCQSLREDGKYIEAGENDNLIVQKLESNPKAVGIFGYSFLEQNEDKVQGSVVDGVAPSFESIADSSYAYRVRCSSTSRRRTSASSRVSRSTSRSSRASPPGDRKATWRIAG